MNALLSNKVIYNTELELQNTINNERFAVYMYMYIHV